MTREEMVEIVNSHIQDAIDDGDEIVDDANNWTDEELEEFIVDNELA